MLPSVKKHNLCYGYNQLEDDVISAPSCISKMKNFAMKLHSQQWFVLLFSQLGFIGKDMIYKF